MMVHDQKHSPEENIKCKNDNIKTFVDDDQ